ncbi:hypothetical protein FKW77_003922 [Venturia effusa]|uniref:Uncharacterized protein n=1 Tax=Venturia effusa TaxID=50376 RepID=A0A517LAS8_9PEZI|nr:hypothetical protein FKW77_003922 [Venturia effusa]
MEYQPLPTPKQHQDDFKYTSHSSGMPTLRQGIHWKAPSIMISSLLLGLAFILGHHFFYQSLHHTPTGGAVFEQQINTGIGTAFAFIVRMFLVIAIGTAYWQLFWHQVKARPTPVAQLDTMSSILGSVLEFFSIRTMVRFPLMAFMAAIIWLIPLAVIFPPASLTVELSPTPLITMRNLSIGVPDFNKNQFAQLLSNGNNAGSWTIFGGARAKVMQIANSVASRGQVLDFPAPSPNSSYQIAFMGPALQCNAVEGAPRATLLQNTTKALNCSLEARHRKDKDACQYMQMYLAWAPGYSDTSGRFEAVNVLNNIGASREETNGTACSLFIATSPTIENSKPWDIVNCSLYNASYHVTVDYTGGVQRLEVSRNITSSVGYFSTLDSIGSATEQESTDVDPVTGENATLYTDLNQFGYQAIMAAFGELLAGQISIDMYNAIGRFDINTNATSILATSLTQTIELFNLSQILETCYGGGGFLVCNEEADNNVLNITAAPQGMISLPRAAEQLFENITLSLLSNNAFLSVPATSPTTKVTFNSPQNRYVYTWWRLVAPYISALVLSVLATAIGSWAMLANGMSYTQNFSTVLRTTRNAYMQDAVLHAMDSTGADPLPKHIAKAKVDFRAQDAAFGLEERPKEDGDATDSTSIRA